MGAERVILEDGVHAPVVRGQERDVLPVEQDPPAVGLFETRDQAKKRRLSASARPEKREELSPLHGKRDIVDCLNVTESLRNILELEELAHLINTYASDGIDLEGSADAAVEDEVVFVAIGLETGSLIDRVTEIAIDHDAVDDTGGNGEVVREAIAQGGAELGVDKAVVIDAFALAVGLGGISGQTIDVESKTFGDVEALGELELAVAALLAVKAETGVVLRSDNEAVGGDEGLGDPVVEGLVRVRVDPGSNADLEVEVAIGVAVIELVVDFVGSIGIGVIAGLVEVPAVPDVQVEAIGGDAREGLKNRIVGEKVAVREITALQFGPGINANGVLVGIGSRLIGKSINGCECAACDKGSCNRLSDFLSVPPRTRVPYCYETSFGDSPRKCSISIECTKL